MSFAYRGSAGEAARVSLPIALKRRHWYRLWAGYDRAAGRLLIGAQPLGEGEAKSQAAELEPLPEGLTFTLAGHFNVRLEDPALHTLLPEEGRAPPEPQEAPPGTLLAWWDFSEAIDSQAILDRGPLALGGRLVNVPTRAVCGARWEGETQHWCEAPED